ncbi:MAG: HDOD domain-containing protein [Acidobacteria bacterium]|nr:HDOD domain-containing protein [Acidobacteriota bacterium]
MIPNQILDGIEHLDPLPVTARRLSDMLGREDVNIRDIADVVQYDAAVAANVVRVANSAAYAGRYPVERVRDAVVRLGTATLLTIVLGRHIQNFRGAAPMYSLSEDDLYMHSAAASLMIKAMAAECRGPLPATCSVAALLHDIGKLIMVRYMKADVSSLLSLCNEKKINFVDAERELLGCDHAEVGGAVARKWGFPTEITSAIENHHNVSRGGNGIVLDAVMLANYAAKSMGIGLGAAAFNIPIDYAGSRERLGLSIEGFERACAQTAMWMADQRKEMNPVA